jgi:hypothetical protein
MVNALIEIPRRQKARLKNLARRANTTLRKKEIRTLRGIQIDYACPPVGKIKRFRYVASTMHLGWTGVLWWALVDDFRTLPLGQIVAGIPHIGELSLL